MGTGLQYRARRYVARVYWFAVAMVALFGTIVTDALHIVLGISYLVSTLVCSAGVAVVLWWWHRSEGTLSIHSITSRDQRHYGAMSRDTGTPAALGRRGRPPAAARRGPG